MSSPPASPPRIWAPPLRRLTLGLILVVLANAFEALAVATVLPTTSEQLDGLALYGWTFSAYMLTNVIGITLGGRQSDLRGPGSPFLLGTLLFVAGLAVSGLAPSMAVIVAGRALQGVGGGLLSASAYAAIALAYGAELQPRMLATLSTAWVVPGLVGPGLASMIATATSWRWVFLGLLPLVLLSCALALPALRALPAPTLHRDSAHADGGRVVRALALGAGTFILLASLNATRFELALPGLLGGTALALHGLRGLLPAGTLTARPGLPAAVASMALVTFAFFGTEAFVPLAMHDVRGGPVLLGGAALTSAAVTWALGAWLPVRIGERIGRRALISIGVAILAAGVLTTAALLLPHVPITLAIATWGLAGLGMGIAFTTTSAAILESSIPGQEGSAAASLQLAQVLGAALATGAGGAIVAASPDSPPRLGIAAVDALMLAALALAMFAARRIPQRSSAALSTQA